MAEHPELGTRDRGPGAALAAARTVQNLSIADVARQLKLSPGQVAALEAGEFERLPGPVFVRGFVRNYARLLKLDPDRIVDAIGPEASGGELRNEIPSSRGTPFPTAAPRRRPRFVLVALLILVALAAYEFYWKDRVQVVTVTKPAPAPVPAVTEPPRATEPAPRELPAAIERAEQQPAAAMPNEPPTQAGEPASVVAPLPVATEPAATEPAQAELHFVFEKDSWVQIRDVNGKTVLTRLNPAGSEQRITGNPPFTLVIGNAGGVQLTYNERPVDLRPHVSRDDVARFTLE